MISKLKIKRNLLATLACLMMFSQAQARDSFLAQAYFGVSFGSSDISPEGESNGFVVDNENDMGFKIYGGHHFGSQWAWEISYTDFGAASVSSPTNATLNALVSDGEIAYKVPAVWVKYLPLNSSGRINIDLKAGLASLDVSTNNSSISFEQESSTQLALGISIEGLITNNWFVKVAIDSYDSDANYIGFGLGYYFGES